MIGLRYAKAVLITVAGVVILTLGLPSGRATAESPTLGVSGSVWNATPGLADIRYDDFTVVAFNPDIYPNYWTQDFRAPDGFALELPANAEYEFFVRGRPASEWATTYYGNTAFRSEATPLALGSESIGGLTFAMRYGGSITGTLTHDYSITLGRHTDSAWAGLVNPATGRVEEYFGGVYANDPNGDYEIKGLAEGTYKLFFQQRAYLGWGEHFGPEFRPEFYPDVADEADAELVEVTAGGVVEGLHADLDPWAYSVERIAGADRFETASELALLTPNIGDVAYIANGQSWPDALSAGPSAAKAGTGLLLVQADSVPAATAAALRDAEPDLVIIVGGAGVVSDAVARQIEAITHGVVERVAGVDRFATSAAVARRAFGDGGAEAAWLATGLGFPDALSAGSAAAIAGLPVVLADPRKATIDTDTANLLSTLGVRTGYVAGGTAIFSDQFIRSLSPIVGSTARYGGKDRYETSWMVAESTTAADLFPVGPRQALLASGAGFADALAAVPVAGVTGAPVLLTPPDCVTAGTETSLRLQHAEDVTLIGGRAVLSPHLEQLSEC